jgi:hypothetical protein
MISALQAVSLPQLPTHTGLIFSIYSNYGNVKS